MDKLGKWVCGANQKWADLLKNEIFVVLEEGESFSQEFALRAEQRLETAPGNCAAMLSQIREELNTPTEKSE